MNDGAVVGTGGNDGAVGVVIDKVEGDGVDDGVNNSVVGAGVCAGVCAGDDRTVGDGVDDGVNNSEVGAGLLGIVVNDGAVGAEVGTWAVTNG